MNGDDLARAQRLDAALRQAAESDGPDAEMFEAERYCTQFGVGMCLPGDAPADAVSVRRVETTLGSVRFMRRLLK
jgi:hypothetical protein